MSVRLLSLREIDKPDELEIAWEEAHKRLTEKIEGRSDEEVNTIVLKEAVGDGHAEITNALLYGILTKAVLSPSRYLQLLTYCTRDKFAYCIATLKKLVYEKYSKLSDTSKDQLLWLVSEFVALRIPDIEVVCIGLLRQTILGNILPRNIWLQQQLVNIFTTHIDWLMDQHTLLPYVLYNFLAIINDHTKSTFDSLRELEVALCVKILRERFDAVKVLGRDLVRLLANVARIPEIEKVFRDVMGAQSGNPPQSNLRTLCHMHTPKQYIQSRVTPEMESWLLFIMQSVKMGNQRRYQQWFSSKYLATVESDTLIPELIRFVCGVYHPPNEILRSEITQRWAVIGWLLHLPHTPHAAANAKLALFIDWLFYVPKLDSIMLIEPAILLMIHSIPKYIDITASLIEFLLQISEHYLGNNPSYKEDMKRGIYNSMRNILDKKVITSLEPLHSCQLLDPKLREAIKKAFEPFIVAEQQRDDRGLRRSQGAIPSAGASAPLTPPPAQPTNNLLDASVLPSVFTSDLPPNKQATPSSSPAKVAQAPAPPQAQPTSAPESSNGAAPPPQAQSQQTKKPPAATGSTQASDSPPAEDESDLMEQWKTAVKTAPPVKPTGSADTFLSSEPPTVEEIENFKSDVTSEDANGGPLFTAFRKAVPVNRLEAKTLLKRILRISISIISELEDSEWFCKKLATLLMESLHTELLRQARPEQVLYTSPKKTHPYGEGELEYNFAKDVTSGEDMRNMIETPLYFVILRQFVTSEETSRQSLLELLAALRKVEPSFGWRLLAFLVRRKRLIPSPAISTQSGDTNEAEDSETEARAKKAFEAMVHSIVKFDDEQAQKPQKSRGKAGSKDNHIFGPYLELLAYMASTKAGKQNIFVEDCRSCAEHNVVIFLEMLPLLLRYLSQYSVACEDLVHIVCSFVYPSQLYNICCSLSQQEYDFIDKAMINLAPQSLSWDSMAQYCFWRLAHAEFTRANPEGVEDFLIDFIPQLDPNKHEEALSGALQMITTIPPSAEFLQMALQLPLTFSRFVSAVLSVWGSSTVTLRLKESDEAKAKPFDWPARLSDALGAVAVELTKKGRGSSMSEDTRKKRARRALQHLTLWILQQKVVDQETIISQGLDTKLRQLISAYNLENEFTHLEKLINTASPPPKSSARKSKNKKADSSEEEEDEKSSTQEEDDEEEEDEEEPRRNRKRKFEGRETAADRTRAKKRKTGE